MSDGRCTHGQAMDSGGKCPECYRIGWSWAGTTPTPSAAAAAPGALSDEERQRIEKIAAHPLANWRHEWARLLASEAHWQARCERAEAALREAEACLTKTHDFLCSVRSEIALIDKREAIRIPEAFSIIRRYWRDKRRALSGARPGEGQ